MRLNIGTVLGVCFTLAASLGGCSSEGGAAGTGSEQVCAVGTTPRTCTCGAGVTGSQSCNAGTWSTCSCATTTTDAGALGSTSDTGVSPGTNPDGTPGLTGAPLPCEVSTLLANRCGSCHGRNNQYPAPMKLENWADLTANSPTDVKKKVFESVLARVHDADRPMPPPQFAPRLSENEISTLQTWVNAGAKPAASGATCATPDQPSKPDAGVDPMPGPTVDMTGSPEDCEQYYELQAHKPGSKDEPFEVASGPGQDGNQYHCFYFDPKYMPESQGLWFKSLVDNNKHLHHWLLYASEVDVTHGDGSDSPCTAAEPGAYLIAGWAPGAPDYKPPADVGLSMPTGSTAKLILEVHWFNDSGAPIKDKSGVRFCTAKKGTRPHTAGIHFTGGEGICLQPGQSQDVVGMCDPDDVEDIHILRVWPHMHKLGRRMKVSILRANGERKMIHDGSFNFEDQRAYDVDEVMKPGDRLETVCSYMNTTNAPVPFGEDTQEEMCFGFITAWPAGALQNGIFNLGQWLGGAIQPARRCLDPLGILNSCNGLADYPPPGG